MQALPGGPGSLRLLHFLKDGLASAFPLLPPEASSLAEREGPEDSDLSDSNEGTFSC